MSIVRPASRWSGGRLVGAALVGALLSTAACGGGDPGPVDQLTEQRGGHNAGPTPTLPGGVALVGVDPAAPLVGAALSFGTPLPSEQAAAEAFTADPEVAAVLARRVFTDVDARHLADVVVLALDGQQIFDEGVLAAFEHGAVAAIGGGPAADRTLAGATAIQAGGADGRIAIGFLHGNLLTIVSGPVAADVELVATRQLEALARGEAGSAEPHTPMAGLPADAALVAVPTVTFAPIPPEVEEPGPVRPQLAGAASVQGRYGVVAGERRAVVWVFAVDRGSVTSAEALQPAMVALAASRAEGAPPQLVETIDRVVLSSTNADGTASARVFRHQGLVLLVEGVQADQLDAVTTAWITALGPG